MKENSIENNKINYKQTNDENIHHKKMSLVDLTKIYDSRSFDALSRSDRASAKFQRKDFLFNKFLELRKPTEKLQLTHEHILGRIFPNSKIN